jgi:hypothetical protein
MKTNIKSGKEILDEFFFDLPTNDSLDLNTVVAIVALYNDGKFSDKNLSNALFELREAELNDKNK